MSAESKSSKLKTQVTQAWRYKVNHQLTEAEEAFRTAISTAPTNVDALYGLGLVLMEKGEDKEAVKLFNEAVSLLEGGIYKQQEVRASLLRWQILGHIEMITKGNWNLSKISNVMPE